MWQWGGGWKYCFCIRTVKREIGEAEDELADENMTWNSEVE